MQLLIVLAGIIAGVLWTSGHTRTFTLYLHGQPIHGQIASSWQETASGGLIVGVAAYIAVGLAIYLWHLGCYIARGRKDRTWRMMGRAAGNAAQFSLVRREGIGETPLSDLGPLECRVIGPSGRHTFGDGEVLRRGDGEAFVQWTREPHGSFAREYRVCWYGSNRPGRFHEITRGRVQIPSERVGWMQE